MNQDVLAARADLRHLVNTFKLDPLTDAQVDSVAMLLGVTRTPCAP